MGLFISPKKLIELLKNKDNLSLQFRQSPEWFLSEAGQTVYQKCETKADRILFFYEYLNAISGCSHELQNLMYRLAFVMEDSMLNSALPFAGFPQIMDEAKNPIVAMAKEKRIDESKCCVADLLRRICALTGQAPNSVNLYQGLSKQNEDGSFPDQYIIEREIIWAFGVCKQLKDGDFSYTISDAADYLVSLSRKESAADE